MVIIALAEDLSIIKGLNGRELLGGMSFTIFLDSKHLVRHVKLGVLVKKALARHAKLLSLLLGPVQLSSLVSKLVISAVQPSSLGLLQQLALCAGQLSISL